MRPKLLLTYAQSLNGTIAYARDTALRLSGAEAMQMTHQLRAEHDAILVGIGTVLADDPQLTVRLVAGANPQIVVLDSQLRCPADAQVVNNGAWVVGVETAAQPKKDALIQAGADVILVGRDQHGRVDLPQMLDALAARGIHSVMVEGGAQIITQFLRAGLVDRVVVTIAPRLTAGVNVIDLADDQPFDLTFEQVEWRKLGHDMIMLADVQSNKG